MGLAAPAVAAVDEVALRRKVDSDTDSELTEPESNTPTTTGGDTESESEGSEEAPQLGPGLYHDDIKPEDMTPSQQTPTKEQKVRSRSGSNSSSSTACPEGAQFTKEETLFVFDWDDTLLPSSWIRSQGLRLDDASRVNTRQRLQLAEVAPLVIETLQLAKQHGTVVLVTSAERGWIELSCRKFLPTVLPHLESLRMVSARTSYESRRNPSPLDWKLRAFEAEISRHYGAGVLEDASVRKNVLSLGDGAHEREAVIRTTASARSCRCKSLKFVERPDLSQIIKQHELIIGCFDNILHHDADLDLCINCP